MSGGSTTSTSSSANPQFQQAYGNLVNQASSVASTPLQQYSGNLVAPLSPDQQSGITATQHKP